MNSVEFVGKMLTGLIKKSFCKFFFRSNVFYYFVYCTIFTHLFLDGSASILSDGKNVRLKINFIVKKNLRIYNFNFYLK